MSNTGIAEFKRMVLDFTDLGALGLKLAVAAPFIGLTIKLGPPPVHTVSVLTALSEFIVLLWTFHFWYGLNDAAQNRRMKAALLFFCAGLIASLALIGTFTLSRGAGTERVVKGFILQPSIQPLIGRELPTVDDALRAAQYDASEVWLQSSIAAVHVTLIAIWLITFAALTAFIALFVIARRKGENAASPVRESSG